MAATPPTRRSPARCARRAHPAVAPREEAVLPAGQLRVPNGGRGDELLRGHRDHRRSAGCRGAPRGLDGEDECHILDLRGQTARHRQQEPRRTPGLAPMRRMQWARRRSGCTHPWAQQQRDHGISRATTGASRQPRAQISMERLSLLALWGQKSLKPQLRTSLYTYRRRKSTSNLSVFLPAKKISSGTFTTLLRFQRGRAGP